MSDMSDYMSYIKSEKIRRPIYKVDFLDRVSEKITMSMTGDMIDSNGQVTTSLNDGVRRTCSISLKNFDESYCEFFRTLGIGNKFKVYTGYYINGKDILFPQGVYVMDNPVLISNLSDKEVNISGTDKWSMLNGTSGGILQNTYVIPKGTKLGDIVCSLLKLDIVSDVQTPSVSGGDYYYDISTNASTSLANFALTYDITKDAGSCVSDLLLDICANANAYVYYNANGRLTVSPYEYDSVKPSSWAFIGAQAEYKNNDINYISAQKTYNYADVFNATMVIADNSQNSNIPITAEAVNNDASDPNSLINLGYKKYKIITDYTQGISTTQQAQERANYELKKAAAQQSSVSVSCLPLYHLDVNNVVMITDKFINSDRERFLIQGITTPLSVSGTMTLDLVKARGYESYGGQ